MAKFGYKLSIELSKNIEDFLFVNQLVTRSEIKRLLNPDRDTESRMTTQKDLSQFAHQYLLEVIEQNHQKLYDVVKKKLGLTRSLFDKIISSGDIYEWSIGACLHAQQLHDPKVIQEAESVDEATEMLHNSYYEGQ